MKIAIMDPYQGKFTSGMQEWWEKHGHEVRRDTYYDPDLVRWADIVWFYTCDNNIKNACYPDKNDPTTAGWDMHDMDLTGKRIVVNPIDIEVWYGHQNNVDWSLVTDVVFIAKHIQDLANNFEGLRESKARQHVIQHGIDLSKWTYKERKPGYNIGIVSELWESKGTDLVLQVAYRLKQINPKYNITWLGRWSEYEWDKAYFLDFVKRNELSIKLVEHVESVDEFLEDKNYLLHASKKEAFSFATAEAMAKGIKPILHHFYGAEHIWPWMTWQSIDQAVSMMTTRTYREAYNSAAYLKYLFDYGYTLDQQMQCIEDEVFKGGM